MVCLLAALALAVSDDAGCRLAEPGVSGCVESAAGSAQYFDGYWEHAGLSLFFDSYPLGLAGHSGLYAGIYSPSGVATRNVFPPNANSTLTLTGRLGWGEYGPNVLVTGEQYRDGGVEFQVNAAFPCNDVPLFMITAEGGIQYGAAVTAACSAGYSPGLFHRGGYSGAPSLTREPGHYMLLEHGFTSHENLYNRRLNEDNSHPSCDGSTPQTFVYPGDGLCYYEPASRHGGLTIGSTVPQRHGFLMQWDNPVDGDGTSYTNHRAAVDVNGGYVMTSGLTKAQFPAMAVVNVHNGHLQDWYGIDGGVGAQAGALYYATDTDRWGHMGNDGGWKDHVTKDDLSVVLTYINARFADAGFL